MIDYVYNGNMEQNISISKMLRLGLTHGGGPVPRLTAGGNTTNIWQSNGAFIPFDGTTNKGIAIPLLTCVAVLFSSTDPNATLGTYVYHALSGTVNNATINNAVGSLGNPPLASVVVLYTFPNPSDPNYVASAQAIVNYGIPANQVLFAPKLPTNHFGSGGNFLIGI